MKKLFNYLLIASVVIMAACNAEDVINESPVNKNGDDVLAAKEKAYKLGSKILDSFKPSVARTLEDETIYPNYYGGMYIDEEGNLNILVKGETETNRAILSRSGGSEDFIIHPCLYSYTELKDVMNCIDSYNQTHSESDVFKNFNSAKLDERNNTIVVELKDCNESNIAEFKREVADSPVVIFNQSATKSVEHSLKAGDAVYLMKDDFYQATCGYRAMLNNNIGWVTVAHSFSQGQSVYNSARQVIGMCSKSLYQGTVDAAFCRSTDANYAPVNNLPGGASLSTSTVNLISGMDVALYGGKTIVASAGVITDLVFSFNTESNIYLTDVALGDYWAQDGDSGGPIVHSQNGVNYVVGIHHGLYGNSAVIIKESNIRSSLGAVRY